MPGSWSLVLTDSANLSESSKALYVSTVDDQLLSLPPRTLHSCSIQLLLPSAGFLGFGLAGQNREDAEIQRCTGSTANFFWPRTFSAVNCSKEDNSHTQADSKPEDLGHFPTSPIMKTSTETTTKLPLDLAVCQLIHIVDVGVDLGRLCGRRGHGKIRT